MIAPSRARGGHADLNRLHDEIFPDPLNELIGRLGSKYWVGPGIAGGCRARSRVDGPGPPRVYLSYYKTDEFRAHPIAPTHRPTGSSLPFN